MASATCSRVGGGEGLARVQHLRIEVIAQAVAHRESNTAGLFACGNQFAAPYDVGAIDGFVVQRGGQLAPCQRYGDGIFGQRRRSTAAS